MPLIHKNAHNLNVKMIISLPATNLMHLEILECCPSLVFSFSKEAREDIWSVCDTKRCLNSWCQNLTDGNCPWQEDAGNSNKSITRMKSQESKFFHVFSQSHSLLSPSLQTFPLAACIRILNLDKNFGFLCSVVPPFPTMQLKLIDAL